MGDSFTIQISSNLVRQLADDVEKSKKKTRRPKPKTPPQQPHTEVPQKQISNDSEAQKPAPPTGWPFQPPLYSSVPPQQHPAKAELDAIRSVLQESEKVLERLQMKEENMLQEVTKRAKDLHDQEFKIPDKKPVPCLDEKDACLKCYQEHLKDPLKCSRFVKDFADCARRVRQQH